MGLALGQAAWRDTESVSWSAAVLAALVAPKSGAKHVAAKRWQEFCEFLYVELVLPTKKRPSRLGGPLKGCLNELLLPGWEHYLVACVARVDQVLHELLAAGLLDG